MPPTPSPIIKVDFEWLWSDEYFCQAWQVTKTYADGSASVETKDPYAGNFDLRKALAWLERNGYTVTHDTRVKTDWHAYSHSKTPASLEWQMAAEARR